LISEDSKGEGIKIDKETGEKYLTKMQFNVYRIELGEKSNDIEINLCDDLTEYRWVKMYELKNYKLTPPSVELFGELGWL